MRYNNDGPWMHFVLSSGFLMVICQDISIDNQKADGNTNSIATYGGGRMHPNTQNAFDTFLHTGKVRDYLNYIDTKHQAEASSVPMATGENLAHYNERDCSAGEGNRRI